LAIVEMRRYRVGDPRKQASEWTRPFLEKDADAGSQKPGDTHSRHSGNQCPHDRIDEAERYSEDENENIRHG
jgi:hypothetical protein